MLRAAALRVVRNNGLGLRSSHGSWPRSSRCWGTATSVAPAARRSVSKAVVIAGIASLGASVLVASVSPHTALDAEEGPHKHAAGGGLALASAVPKASRWQLWRRAVWLVWSFALVILLAPGAVMSSDFCERYYYLLVYQAICYSKSAALAKWSQWASVRYDLLPATLCMLLGQLQASAPTHSYAHTIEELESAGVHVGSSSSSIAIQVGPRACEYVLALDSLEELPRASGSIAQIHFAQWQGKPVVVKVRHPRVGEELLMDFELMRSTALAVHEWVPALRWLNAPSTVSQFEAAMAGQCDLSQEAVNLNRFNANFRRKSAWTCFPAAVYSTPAVLVESFESGVLMSDFVQSWRGLELPAESKAEAHFVISRGEDAYLQMLLVDNFMHADLHPGNIFFRKSGTAGKPQIVILDAGMAAHLTSTERKNFIGLLQALGDGDGHALAERVLNFSQLRGDRESNAAFTADIKSMCAERCRGYGTGIDVGEVVREILQLLYKHGRGIDGNYATLIANMLCLEGMARDLEPKFNVLDVAYPLLRAHQLLGDTCFQHIFSWGQWLMPLPFWELTYRVGLYAALNGEKLKRFQI